MTTSPFTANLTAPPTGTNFAIYFLNSNENLTNAVPTSSPAITNLVYANAQTGMAGTWFADTPSQFQPFCQQACPGVQQHWGTIAVEIKRP